MPMRYPDLDDEVRACMLRELEADIASDDVYPSTRLTQAGLNAWPELLREAIASYGDRWLAEQLSRRGYLNEMEQKRKRGGDGFTMARVPSNAADILAEGEFNRLYCRAMCVCTVDEGGAYVEVCRGRDSSRPRPESEAMIGTLMPAADFVEDLRSSKGVESALGLPQVNSGLTVKRPTLRDA